MDDGTEKSGRRGGSPAAADGGGLSLRELKKIRTRERISGEATRLFVERGFDHVTVAEVARAAEVSTMTVFNYFPRKEDLFLDRVPEIVELVTRAVRERGEGRSPLEALQGLALDLLERRHPLAGVGEGVGYWWRVLVESPALMARGREALDEFQGTLAGLFAEAEGAGPDAYGPRLAAALTVAGYRSVYATVVRRQLAGAPVEEIAAEEGELLRHTFEVLSRVVRTGSPVHES
ncbi:TetR/AcrR family transcriptional regulator [Streptomyces sp. NPDC039022]|uniref:TetR/AcrR family transcriptional regulator n=1 Tax=Streptomyces sp. NPDC039022 TaxID=3157091 RepID=UPI0033F9B7AA